MRRKSSPKSGARKQSTFPTEDEAIPVSPTPAVEAEDAGDDAGFIPPSTAMAQEMVTAITACAHQLQSVLERSEFLISLAHKVLEISTEPVVQQIMKTVQSSVQQIQTSVLTAARASQKLSEYIPEVMQEQTDRERELYIMERRQLRYRTETAELQRKVTELEKHLAAKLVLTTLKSAITFLRSSGPSGVVTLCFSDVQGAASLWQRYQQAMSLSLELHNEVLRKELRRFNGFEVRQEGDAMFCAFADVGKCFQWCCEVQRSLLLVSWPPVLQRTEDAALQIERGIPIFSGLRVRMGFHTGLPKCVRDRVHARMDYHGPVVDLAARIAANAFGGDINFSKISFGMLEQLGAFTTCSVKRKGEYTFPGFSVPEVVYAALPTELAARKFPADVEKRLAEVSRVNRWISAVTATAAQAEREDQQFRELQDLRRTVDHGVQERMALLERLRVSKDEREDLQKQILQLQIQRSELQGQLQAAQQAAGLEKEMPATAELLEELALPVKAKYTKADVIQLSREVQSLRRKNEDLTQRLAAIVPAPSPKSKSGASPKSRSGKGRQQHPHKSAADPPGPPAQATDPNSAESPSVSNVSENEAQHHITVTLETSGVAQRKATVVIASPAMEDAATDACCGGDHKTEGGTQTQLSVATFGFSQVSSPKPDGSKKDGEVDPTRPGTCDASTNTPPVPREPVALAAFWRSRELSMSPRQETAPKLRKKKGDESGATKSKQQRELMQAKERARLLKDVLHAHIQSGAVGDTLMHALKDMRRSDSTGEIERLVAHSIGGPKDKPSATPQQSWVEPGHSATGPEPLSRKASTLYLEDLLDDPSSNTRAHKTQVKQSKYPAQYRP